MEQPETPTRLTGAVRELASRVVSALNGGDHFVVVGGVVDATDAEGADRLGLAAVRVLGADTVLPSVLLRTAPAPGDLTAFEQAVRGFPPAPDASPTSRWSHWAMRRTLGLDGAEPDTTWLDVAPWQVLTHQLAVLAALAVPGTDSGVARAAARRPVDVARGFVRAVRRRDWLQAAGAGRWLSLLDGVPDTLALDTGLEFVALMGGTDPRVALQVRAARLLRAGAPV
ncbi:hypothetical protein AB0A69_20245 [Streptomyces sp. NPDC045431]|uniref:hypothetical protein n=1 Tax=Streptomyces sp. NPDC045431 TaxID=3155613 RepID=UPI0033F5124D